MGYGAAIASEHYLYITTQTGAHAPGVCHHCCRRIPRDHARKRAQGTPVLTAFDNPLPLSLQYVKGAGGASYFPVSAITDRLYARNQLKVTCPFP